MLSKIHIFFSVIFLSFSSYAEGFHVQQVSSETCSGRWLAVSSSTNYGVMACAYKKYGLYDFDTKIVTLLPELEAYDPFGVSNDGIVYASTSSCSRYSSGCTNRKIVRRLANGTIEDLFLAPVDQDFSYKLYTDYGTIIILKEFGVTDYYHGVPYYGLTKEISTQRILPGAQPLVIPDSALRGKTRITVVPRPDTSVYVFERTSDRSNSSWIRVDSAGAISELSLPGLAGEFYEFPYPRVGSYPFDKVNTVAGVASSDTGSVLELLNIETGVLKKIAFPERALLMTHIKNEKVYGRYVSKDQHYVQDYNVVSIDEATGLKNLGCSIPQIRGIEGDDIEVIAERPDGSLVANVSYDSPYILTPDSNLQINRCSGVQIALSCEKLFRTNGYDQELQARRRLNKAKSCNIQLKAAAVDGAPLAGEKVFLQKTYRERHSIMKETNSEGSVNLKLSYRRLCSGSSYQTIAVSIFDLSKEFLRQQLLISNRKGCLK